MGISMINPISAKVPNQLRLLKGSVKALPMPSMGANLHHRWAPRPPPWR
jgi:hypothetical protein